VTTLDGRPPRADSSQETPPRRSRATRKRARGAADLLGDQPFAARRRGPAAVLLGAVASDSATLVAVGESRSRTAGSCWHRDCRPPRSLLRALCIAGRRWYPQRILVGVDGSAQSLAALAAAAELAQRLGSTVRVLAATGGKAIPEGESWSERVDEWAPGDPVVNLVDASIQADLVVMGSRGLHGARSLGSVSERVAHRAHSSVLVVRGSGGTSAPESAAV
jgi:nucleotide-binding universal stress UspA family protein